jgi:hypothetical protein
MHRLIATLLLVTLAAAVGADPSKPPPDAIAKYFAPPSEFVADLGAYRSPLKFADGSEAKTPEGWAKRRAEILKEWHGLMGPWPALVEKPKLETLAEERRETFRQRKVRLQVAPDRTTEGYLLLPEGRGPFPAVLVVYYDPQTGIGTGEAKLRDFAYQLAKRGFVTLSIGTPGSNFYPSEQKAALQPLSWLAYAAANSHSALANLEEVDPKRIGIVGHSYGGKWAMFASCLYERFAAAAWSDGGIVFDEKRPNVNYWEPWYLGWEAGAKRGRGVITPENPRTGAYKKMMEAGRDLHELHALMAPRPFLVSGGSEDRPARWRALNHSLAVNRVLGAENRVAMTNRPMHGPTEESNEQIYVFFEWALKR